MDYSEKLNELNALPPNAFSQGGAAETIVTAIYSDLEKARAAAASPEAAVQGAQKDLNNTRVQITTGERSLSKHQCDLKKTKKQYEGIEQTINNLRDAFSERGEAPSTDEFETFNREIAAQLRLRTENEQLQSELKGKIAEIEETLIELRQKKANIDTELTNKQAIHSSAIWSLLDLAAGFSSDLMEATSAQLKQILPNKEDGADYLIENDTGLEVAAEDHLLSLMAQNDPTNKPDDERRTQLRLNKKELENNIQLLIDHMTSLRISEERDTDTFVNRLRSAYERVEKEVQKQQEPLESKIDMSENAFARLWCLEHLAGHLNKNILCKTASPSYMQPQVNGVKESEIREQVKETSVIAKRSEDFAKSVVVFLKRSNENLHNLGNRYCSQPMIDGAIDQSISVSREAETRNIFRVVPLIWAIIVTLVVKMVLARNSALAIHENAVSILAMSFMVTWVASILIGRNSRNRRMTRLQNATRGDFERLTRCPVETSKRRPLRWFSYLGNVFKNSIGETRSVRFAPERLDQVLHNLPPRQPIRAFNARKSLWWERANVLLRNCTLLGIPLVLFAIVIRSQPDSGYRTYVSYLKDGAHCTLMTGRLTAADSKTFYLLNEYAWAEFHNGPSAYSTLAKSVFPELYSQTVARDRVVDILTSKENLPKQRCADAGKLAGRDFAAPDKVFPEPFRAQILQAQDALVSIIVDGSVSAHAQHEFSELLHDIKAQLGEDVRDDQVVQLIMSGHLPVSEGITTNGEGGDTTYNFNTKLEGAEEVAIALGELAKTLQHDHENSNRESELRLDGLQEFAKLVGIVVQSNAQLGKVVNSNTQTFEESTKSQVTTSSVVPVFNEGATITLEAAQPSHAIVVSPTVNLAQDRQATTLATHITLVGPGNEQQKVKNTLFMPFFPNPVNESMKKPMEAFKFGLSNAGFKPPLISSNAGNKRDYFTVIADAIKNCLVTDLDLQIDLDVQGHASSSWNGPLPPGSAPEQFNHHLAEGRRIGALMKLKEEIQEGNIQDKIMIFNLDETKALSTFKAVTENGKPSELIAAFENKRFHDFGALKDAQKEWMPVISPPGTNSQNALEEIFARTVTIKVRDFEGVSCAFE